MTVADVLTELGGVAVRSVLVAATSRAEVDLGLVRGDIVTVARGRYALREADAARVAAHRLTGTPSHTSFSSRSCADSSPSTSVG